MESTPEAPVLIVPQGVHASDLIAANGAYNEGLQNVIDQAVAQMTTWVAEYYQ